MTPEQFERYYDPAPWFSVYTYCLTFAIALVVFLYVKRHDWPFLNQVLDAPPKEPLPGKKPDSAFWHSFLVDDWDDYFSTEAWLKQREQRIRARTGEAPVSSAARDAWTCAACGNINPLARACLSCGADPPPPPPEPPRTGPWD